MLTAAALFGTTGTAQALGPPEAPSAAVGALRLLVGAAGLVAVTGGAAFRVAARFPLAVAVGAAGVATYQVAFFLAVRDVGVATGTLVGIGSAPLLTGVLGGLARQGWPGRGWWSATLVALAGLGLLATSTTSGRFDPGGVGLAALAGLSYATYTLAGKRLTSDGAPPVPAIAAAFGAGSLLLVPILLRADLSWLRTDEGIAVAAYLGVVPTTLAYVLFAYGLARLAARTVATLTLGEPLVAAGLAVTVLGERLPLRGLAGVALLLGGLVLIARDPGA